MQRTLKKKALAQASALAFGLVAAAGAQALTANEIEIHGFFTAGATISDADKVYLRTTDDDISFDEDSVLGLQIIVPVDEKITLQAQLLGNGSRESDTNFEVKVDWAFAGYQVNDNLTIRAGRIRAPLLMHMEYIEAGYAYPWIRGPQEVYGLVPFNSFDGVDALFTVPVGDFEFSFQPFIGSKDEELSVQQLGLVIDTELDNIMGAKFSLNNDYVNFVASYASLEFSFDENNVLFLPPSPFAAPTDREVDVFNVGLTVDWNNLIFMSEYAKVKIENAPLGEMPVPTNTAWYATAGYRFGNVMPHITYAELDTENNIFGSASKTVTLGVRYELGDASALKVEWANVEARDNTGGLFGPDAHPNHFNDDADVFSVALDVTF
ncbi:MAG: porin [Porticoccaceae bacterium]